MSEMLNEIILVKLVNDEQYIGTLIEEDDEGIRIINPLKVDVMYSPRNKNKPNVIITPWDVLSKMDNVYFDKLHIIYYTLPKEDIIEFYKKQIDDDIEEQEDNSIIESLDQDTLKAFIERMTSNTALN
jgi:hypothetical protein